MRDEETGQATIHDRDFGEVFRIGRNSHIVRWHITAGMGKSLKFA